MDKDILIVLISTTLALIGTAGTVIGVVYAIMRNFKTDVNNHIDAIIKEMKEERIERREENRKMEQRVWEANKRMDGVYNILLKRTENMK